MEYHAFASEQEEREYRRETASKAVARITMPRLKMLSRAVRGVAVLRNLLGEHPSVVDAEYLVSEVAYAFLGTNGNDVRWEYVVDMLYALTEGERVSIKDAPITLMQWATLIHGLGIDRHDAQAILSSCFDHTDIVCSLYCDDRGVDE